MACHFPNRASGDGEESFSQKARDNIQNREHRMGIHLQRRFAEFSRYQI
jgi:hypothetical protein